MQNAPFDTATPATLLLRAWRSGELLNALPEEARPVTLREGYDAQDTLFQAAGGIRRGWKLGVGSPAAMRAGKLSRPLVGQLDEARCHPDGVHLHLPASTPVTIECEVAFVLARDLPPQAGREVSAEDIRATCLTFEVVRSRFINRKSVGWPSFVADNVGFEALVVGEPICSGLDEHALRVLAETTVVYLDGTARAHGLSGELATDPLNSLAALYAHAAERGETLREGDIVSTGALCEPFDLKGAGHQLSARYLGRELHFSL